MIHSEPGAFVVPAAEGEVPVGVHTLVRVQLADRIDPTLVEEPTIRRAALGKVDGIKRPAPWDNGIDRGRHDVVVATKHDRLGDRKKCAGISVEPVEPAQLIVEFRSRCRVPIGRIDAPHDEISDRRL